VLYALVYRKKIPQLRSQQPMIRAYALALTAVLVVACGQSDATGPSEPLTLVSGSSTNAPADTVAVTPEPEPEPDSTSTPDSSTAEPPDTVVVIPPDPDTTTVVDTVPPPDTLTPPDTTTTPADTITEEPPPPDTVRAPVVLSPTAKCSDARPTDYVTFADEAVDQRVRAQMGRGATDPITCGAVSEVTSVGGGPTATFSWRSLDGLQNMTGLTSLSLYNSPVTDLGPLSELPNLESVTLRGTIGITDISTLAGLDNLRTISLERTGIRDISSLANLPSLAALTVREQPLPDISPLANFQHLTALTLISTNRGNDLAPLVTLAGLTYLGLSGNPNLSDVGPVLANPGIGEGDTVNLQGTKASCDAVNALRDRGVTVYHTCTP
jgi:hypothetical protein